LTHASLLLITSLLIKRNGEYVKNF